MDDQTIATEDQNQIVNPLAIDRNFIEINSRHKVLIGIMDTGIDYNHPLLQKNIHFTLNESGRPIATGWDYPGNDPWPAPYIARTNYFNSNLSEADRAESLKIFMAAQTLINEYPDLEKFFPIERSIEEENAEGFDHGTHVAGLASYDSPEIGLLTYRVVPLNAPAAHEEPNVLDVMKKFSSILLPALNRAIKDGANVINMSLGVSFKQGEPAENELFFSSFKQELTEIVMANPEVLFVVAAGNDGEWIDGTSVSVLPCYIPKKNVICVSALTEKMEATVFTNIILGDEVTTIYAWGNDILSAFPGGSCTSLSSHFDSIAEGPIALAEFASMAREKCIKDQSLVNMSGTSMASPIIARKVAKIRAQFPHYNIAEIKKELFSKAISSKHEDINVWKLPIEKPSWYQQKNKSLFSKDWQFLILKKH